MKKSFIILLSLLFVLSFTVAAFAEVTIGGDARVRGVWHMTYDLDGDDLDDDDRYWDQLIGLDITGKAGNAEARVRLETVDVDLDMAGPEFTDDDPVWGEPDNVMNIGGQLIKVDTAYLHVPVPVGAINIVIDAGLMTRPFGNMFYQGDDHYVTGAEVSGQFGQVHASLFTDKVEETRVVSGDENLADYDNYGGIVTVDIGDDIKVGGILTYENDTTPVDDLSGIEFAAFGNGKIGKIGFAAEVAYKTGDLNYLSAEENSQMGGFASASFEINEQLSVGGAACYAADGFVASTYFTPTTMIGSADGDNPLALPFLEAFGAADDTTSIGVVGSVDFNILDNFAVSGGVGYILLQDQGVGGEDGTAIEVDAGLAYEIAENVEYKFDVAYLSPSDLSATDDPAIGVAHSIEISF
jgi:hypothetical protein